MCGLSFFIVSRERKFAVHRKRGTVPVLNVVYCVFAMYLFTAWQIKFHVLTCLYAKFNMQLMIYFSTIENNLKCNESFL